jgi:hypothetical protein
MLTILAAIIGLIGTAAGIYFKYVRNPPSAAQQVEKVNADMLNAAVNRPDDDAAIKRLRDGTG